jgi:hypothetical protein
MTDRPASWRMPTPKQMDKMAAAVGRKAPTARGLAPDDNLPPEYWKALLEDAGAGGGHPGSGTSGRLLRLSQIPQHLLRVGCRRCGRTVEIQKGRRQPPGTVRMRSGETSASGSWTTPARNGTGRHEEDGCWPSFD